MKKYLLILTAMALSVASASAQDWAKTRLEKSPRHLEWVKVKHGEREVNCFVAYPEVKEKATAVVVIHEIFGLSDWARGVADQLAEAGYIAIAPDLLSGTAPDGGGTAELGGVDAVRKAISSLPADQITADLSAVTDYVAKLPAANGIEQFVIGGHRKPVEGGPKRNVLARLAGRLEGLVDGHTSQTDKFVALGQTNMAADRRAGAPRDG